MCNVPWRQHAHTHTHTGCTLPPRQHTLDAQKKDHLQLNYGQIEPWERRSSKAELELNAEAVCPSHKNTHAYTFQTDEHLVHKHLPLTHTHTHTHRVCLPDKIYLTCIPHFACCIHSEASDRIDSIVKEFSNAGRQMNRYSYNVPVRCFFFEQVCMCLRWCLWISTFLNTGVYFWMHLWMRACVCVCGRIHSDYRLWYSASSLTLVHAPIITAERERDRQRMPSQSKRYYLIKLKVSKKSERYDTTVKAISREGRGRRAAEEEEMVSVKGRAWGTVAGERKRRKGGRTYGKRKK